MKTILVDAVHTFFLLGTGINQSLYDLLEQFPNPKILVTGATPEQQQVWGLVNMPYPLFSLHHQPEKSDPQYFQQLLSKYNLTADQVIYFEHDPAAIASAETLGILTFFYNSTEPDLPALREFLNHNT